MSKLLFYLSFTLVVITTKSSHAQFLNDKYKIQKPDTVGMNLLDSMLNVQNEMVEKQPEYPGGMANFFKYLGRKMKYPLKAKKNKISGKVFVAFVIGETGEVELNSVKVVKGIGYGCDEEAVRLIRATKKWSPGRYKDGKPVSVRIVLPVIFHL